MSLDLLGQLLLAVLFVGFVSARITQFLVLDSLIGMNPETGSKLSEVVDRFAYWGDDWEQSEAPVAPGMDRSWIRGKVGDLLTCPFCLGFWISAACWVVIAGSLGVASDYSLLVNAAAIFAVAAVQSWHSAQVA